MLSFIAQFDTQSGPDAAKTYKLRLDIDEAHRAGFLPIVNNHTKGDTFLVIMIPVDDEFSNIGEAVNETADDTRIRLNRQMHALLRETAANRSLTIAEVKTALKERLKKKQYIQSSTKELDVKGLAAAIYILQNEF